MSQSHTAPSPATIHSEPRHAQSPAEILEENRKLRRLQMMMNLVMSAIAQDPGLSVERAAEMVAGSRRAALAMFPDKELAFNLLWKPRLQRLMTERYRLQ